MELPELGRQLEQTAAAAPRYQTAYSYDLDGDPEHGSGYSRLHDYWRSARKHLWLILGIMLLITTLAAFYMARQPDVYEAQARLQVDLEMSNPVLGSIKTNSFVLNTPFQDPTYFNTQIQILSSAGLLGRVVKTLDLEHSQAFLRPQSGNGSTWENLKRMFGFGRKPEEKSDTA
ncbi:MAG TPA: Wzz/FepE/Etk N-terminal domain-containing protein, partial [Pyrinomonadaceae bacterium]